VTLSVLWPISVSSGMSQSIQSFLANADQIASVAPQVFTMDSTGMIRGQVDPRVIETARANGIQLAFENFHVRDKDAFTAFTREAVDSVMALGYAVATSRTCASRRSSTVPE
jgi:putative aminopeptidase FrvX